MSLIQAAIFRRRRHDTPHEVVAPGPVVSYDAAFCRGLNSVVAVEFDRNSRGYAPGQHAGSSPVWVPVPGLETVPCRLVWKKSVPVNGESRLNMIRTGRVLFGQAVVADSRYRLRYVDPAFGTVHIYLTGPVRDAHQMGHHWVADIQDRNFL